MKITPFSKHPYHPMLLANGTDAALVNYSGSMYSGLQGHNEGHQGTPCGWYKSPHRQPFESIMPTIQTGYGLAYNGLLTEPDFYEQEFNPKTAIFKTTVKVYGIECEITSFMASEHLLVEHYEVIDIPPEGDISLILSAQIPTLYLHYHIPPFIEIDFKNMETDQINIEYRIAKHKITGSGFMLTDKEPNAGANMTSDKAELRFDNLSKGWSVTKFLSLIDNKDQLNYDNLVKQNIARCKRGYKQIKKEHEKEWLDYTTKSSINIPDDDLQYIYDLGIYTARAHLHPETGGLSCGMVTNLWGGGTCCPDDANYSHVAMLRTGNSSTANHHLNFYRNFKDKGNAFAKEHNMPGMVIPVWSNIAGDHVSKDYEWFIFYAKMSQLGCAVQAFLWFWNYYPEHEKNQENLRIMEEILDFIYAPFIIDDGSKAHVKDCKPGNELIDKAVKNDTYSTTVFAHVFSGFEKMSKALGVPLKDKFSGLGKRLYEAVSKNINDGVLYDYLDADFKFGAPLIYIYSLPEESPPSECVRNWAELNTVRTPWGLSTDVPMSSYRDWPWAGARMAIAYAHMGDSKNAFSWLKDSVKYAAANGALPEKVRIDGYPVNYWYSSTHALLTWAMTYAMCHQGKDGSLKLLYGLDGQWQDVDFTGLRVFGGLEISIQVKERNVTYLKIENHSLETQQFDINVNPLYSCDKNGDKITLNSGEEHSWTRR